MNNNGGYISKVETDWEPWFAWHPVSTIDKKVVWLKDLQRRWIHYFVRDSKDNIVWEETSLQYKTTIN